MFVAIVYLMLGAMIGGMFTTFGFYYQLIKKEQVKIERDLTKFKTKEDYYKIEKNIRH